MRNYALLLSLFCCLFIQKTTAQNKLSKAKLEALQKEIIEEVDKMKDFSAQLNDVIFSYGELGFQETETSKYLTQLLEKEGFTIERNISGIPTAWIAKWGNGKPLIAIGSDVDCIPKASQKPGVAYHDPIVEGAPGHGEGHNSGQALNITSALVLEIGGLKPLVWRAIPSELRAACPNPYWHAVWHKYPDHASCATQAPAP